MRLIFSAILAAALVFGGTLLFAGYFDGIEVRGAGPKEGELGPFAEPPREGNQIRGTLWHCPEVERVMAGPLPGIFEVSEEDRALFKEGAEVTVEDFTFYKRGTEWTGVSLRYLFEVGDRKVKGKTISCNYRNPDRPKSMELNLIPDLYGEIEVDPGVEGGWDRWIGTDCAAPAFGCRGSTQECGFYVHQTDIRIREMKTRDDEPCTMWNPHEVPVEQGGLAADGED